MMRWMNAMAAVCMALCGSAVMAQTPPAQNNASADLPALAPKPAGNQELPKVLYIVPWKKAAQGEVDGRPQSSVINEELTPIDRDAFRRQMQYQAQQAHSNGQKRQSRASMTRAAVLLTET